MRKTIDKLTPTEVKKFHAELERRFNVKFVHSGPIAWALRKLFARLASKLGTTVPHFFEIDQLRPCAAWKYVLLPYHPGCPDVSAESQCYTAIHEIDHCNRIRSNKDKLSVFGWYKRYFTNSKFRALEEVSAKLARAEFQFWAVGYHSMGGTAGYFFDSSDEALMVKDYKNRMAEVERHGKGTAFNDVARAAIKIAKDMGVNPR